MPDLPTGTLTLLFTDIEGSTRLLQQLGDDYTALLAGHHRILRAALARWGGHEVTTQGDAFFIVFLHAGSAVGAAIEAQRALAAAVWPSQVKVRIRMGLHTGVPTLDGADYTGLDVHRAARICAAGHGAQVLLSRATAELVERVLPDGVTLRDLGQHSLKDLRHPQHLYQLIVPGLPADFPPLKSLNTSLGNLPIQLTNFIGRENELAELKRRLAQARLVTLTGSGGCGKTRLSLQAAAELLPTYPGGVWLAELAPLADPALLPQTVAGLFGLRDEASQTWLTVLTEFLRPQKLLLILDNCEHLIDACAQLAEALLQHCPEVSLLASSREALGIPGEFPFRLASLAAPDPSRALPVADLLRFDAIRLFVDRAEAAEPAFALTPDNAAAVVQICARLDGIPLAIELAAARVRVLSVDQIAKRLDDCFRLLTGGARTALPRQQTLRALIDWSYDLLTEPERIVFRRLAAFAGGWSLEAAEFVCEDETDPAKLAGGSPPSASRISAADVLDLLTHLLEKSLVIKHDQTGPVRYRRLETIRQYARERFAESGEAERVRRRHYAWCLRLAEATEPDLEGQAAADTAALLQADHDNLRAALAWSLEAEPADALRLAGALSHFWYLRGYKLEGRAALARALAAAPAAPPAWRARGLRWAGLLASDLGDYQQAADWLSESASLYRELHDQAGLASALNSLGNLAWYQGDYDAASQRLSNSLAIRRDLNDQSGIATTLANLGVVTMLQEDYPAARRQLEESLALSRALGNKSSEANALNNLAVLAEAQGDLVAAQDFCRACLACAREIDNLQIIAYSLNSLAHVTHQLDGQAEAQRLYRESLDYFLDLDEKRGIAYCLEGFALTTAGQTSAPGRARLFAAAETLRGSIGAPLSDLERSEYERHIAALRAELGAAQFSAAWAEGQALSLERAVALALQADDPS